MACGTRKLKAGLLAGRGGIPAGRGGTGTAGFCCVVTEWNQVADLLPSVLSRSVARAGSSRSAPPTTCWTRKRFQELSARARV